MVLAAGALVKALVIWYRHQEVSSVLVKDVVHRWKHDL